MSRDVEPSKLGPIVEIDQGYTSNTSGQSIRINGVAIQGALTFSYDVNEPEAIPTMTLKFYLPTSNLRVNGKEYNPAEHMAKQVPSE